MIKIILEAISVIWIILAELLTLGGYLRLKDAQSSYKEIYEKYEALNNKITLLYDENKSLLNDIGSDTKNAFKALGKASAILCRNDLKDVAKKMTADSMNFKQIEKIKRINAKFSNVLSASIGAGSGGLLAVGSWALVTVVGTASTGTAISALSGIAATNATLAWFGGGALAAGGAGIAGGTLMLGFIFILPFFIIWGNFTHKKSKRLEEEYKKLEIIILELKSKEKDAINDNVLIRSKRDEIKKICSNFIKAVDKANYHLYAFGYFSHLMRMFAKTFGHGYFKETDRKFITALECEVDIFLVAFGER